jgi:hypothetical protein
MKHTVVEDAGSRARGITFLPKGSKGQQSKVLEERSLKREEKEKNREATPAKKHQDFLLSKLSEMKPVSKKKEEEEKCCTVKPSDLQEDLLAPVRPGLFIEKIVSSALYNTLNNRYEVSFTVIVANIGNEDLKDIHISDVFSPSLPTDAVISWIDPVPSFFHYSKFSPLVTDIVCSKFLPAGASAVGKFSVAFSSLTQSTVCGCGPSHSSSVSTTILSNTLKVTKAIYGKACALLNLPCVVAQVDLSLVPLLPARIAYANVFFDGTYDQALSPDQAVSFNDATTLKNISFDGANTLSIMIAGDYDSEFIVNADSTSVLSFRLLKNDITVPGSVFYSDSDIVKGHVKFSASANDRIKLVTNSTQPVTLQSLSSSGLTIANHSISTAKNIATVTSTPIQVSSGSSIYICLSFGSSRTVLSITDNQTQSYALATRKSYGTLSTEIWYIDNVSASTSYMATATLSGTAHSTLSLVEILGADTPSLANIGTGTSGASASLITDSVSAPVNSLCLLSVVGDEIFSAVAPAFLLDTALSTSIAGSNVARKVGSAGIYSISATVANKTDWAAASVSIQPRVVTPLVNEYPTPASLNLVLLEQKK